MNSEKELRNEIIDLLQKGHAHMSLNDAVKGFPLPHINDKPKNIDYTFWQLLEHIRITQNDILEFCINPNYVYKKWPNDCWPKTKATPRIWRETIANYNKDLNVFIKMIKSPKNNLYIPFSWGEGQTLLREAFTIADHNSYHIGEFAFLRGLLNLWGKTKH